MKTEDRSMKTKDGSSKTVEAVFAHYQKSHPRSKLDKKTKDLIQNRLKDGFTAEDLTKAIDGNHRSPHHCGQNSTGTKFHKLSLIMRDADQVNTFIEHADQPAVVLSSKTQRTLQAGSALLNSPEDF